MGSNPGRSDSWLAASHWSSCAALTESTSGEASRREHPAAVVSDERPADVTFGVLAVQGTRPRPPMAAIRVPSARAGVEDAA
jgi:hypothetical protein